MHVGCFLILTIMISSVVIRDDQGSLWYTDLDSLGILRPGITESYENSTIRRNPYDLSSGYVCPNQECIRVCFFFLPNLVRFFLLPCTSLYRHFVDKSVNPPTHLWVIISKDREGPGGDTDEPHCPDPWKWPEWRLSCVSGEEGVHFFWDIGH